MASTTEYNTPTQNTVCYLNGSIIQILSVIYFSNLVNLIPLIKHFSAYKVHSNDFGKIRNIQLNKVVKN